MKLSQSKSLQLALALLLSPLIATTTLFTGCQSDPMTTTYRVEGTTVKTVDAAMRSWAEWVNAGHATKQQVSAVRAAYNEYYSAQQSVKLILDELAVNPGALNKQKLAEAQAAVLSKQGEVIAKIAAAQGAKQ